MARKITFCVEGLEGRALLSGITYSLTTDQSTYQVGQPIQMTFTETNTGDQPATVLVSPTDFTISQGGNAIWQSDSDNSGQPPTSVTLQPGQSLSQNASWDGTTPYSLPNPNGPAQTWSLNQWGTFAVSNPNAPQGDVATFQITDPISISLTTDMPVYQMGQPVQVTYTESNTSDQELTYLDGEAPALTFWHDGANVTPVAYPQSINLDPDTLAAGSTITWSQIWDGIPESGPFTLDNLSGTFVASYGPDEDPQEYTAQFQITPPTSWDIESSITTDQPVYQAGQPVNMTFTETNAGDQSIPVVVGQQSFQVTQGSNFVWSPPGANTGYEWGMLPPGQSITQTESWNDVLVNGQSAGTGTFVVSNLIDPNGSTATFQIVAPPVTTPPGPIEPITSPPVSDPPTPDPIEPISTTPVSDPPSGPIAPINAPPMSDPPTQGSGATGDPGVGTGPSGAAGSSQVPGTPLVDATVSTNQPAYKVGQSVRITLEIDRRSTTAIALPAAKDGERITIMEGSTVIWEATRVVRASKLRGIKPSQNLDLTTVWNGRPNQPDIHRLKPGAYSIDVDYGDYGGETTIEIGGNKK